MQIVRSAAAHRLLAAFPDAVTAAFLIMIWQAPLTFGAESVFAAMVLIALELPALLALSGLFMLHMERPLTDKLKAVALLCCAMYFIGLMGIKALQAMPSALLLVPMLAMVVSKALIYTTARRDSTWTIEGLRLAIHFTIFLTIFMIAKDFSASVSRGEFTNDAMQYLALPHILLSGDRLPPKSPWVQPWWFILAGACYFLLCSLARYAMSSRTLSSWQGRH
ncbi:hypothetical protein [Luteimonas deserti]|uniref:Uncharacterized protein n=1 Tax=Luteimonas deserti TaxID=2752306 RepID=A0A7Z0QPQ3_9GAMM|nr:hypothetical protein [Luteimonas deserti]NYZ62428.1 hypothetical protein [Luteimonas deserti]